MSPAGWYYTKFLAFTAFSRDPLLVPIGHYFGLSIPQPSIRFRRTYLSWISDRH